MNYIEYEKKVIEWYNKAIEGLSDSEIEQYNKRQIEVFYEEFGELVDGYQRKDKVAILDAFADLLWCAFTVMHIYGNDYVLPENEDLREIKLDTYTQDLIDSFYLNYQYGTELCNDVLAEVCKSNFSKMVDGKLIRDASGKITKQPAKDLGTYYEPHIAELIKDDSIDEESSIFMGAVYLTDAEKAGDFNVSEVRCIDGESFVGGKIDEIFGSDFSDLFDPTMNSHIQFVTEEDNIIEKIGDILDLVDADLIERNKDIRIFNNLDRFFNEELHDDVYTIFRSRHCSIQCRIYIDEYGESPRDKYKHDIIHVVLIKQVLGLYYIYLMTGTLEEYINVSINIGTGVLNLIYATGEDVYATVGLKTYCTYPSTGITLQSDAAPVFRIVKDDIIQ